MFIRNGWLLKVVVVLGLALSMIHATPAVTGAASAAEVTAPGVLGGCGDGTCGYVVK